MSRVFRIPSKLTPEQLRSSSHDVSNGPGGGSAPPDLVESDREADVDELSDGGANSARRTGDRQQTEEHS